MSRSSPVARAFLPFVLGVSLCGFVGSLPATAPASIPVLALAGQERPLPEVRAFLRNVRTHLESDNARQRDYTFVETRRRTRLDRSGRPTSESVTVIESYPGFPGEERWERVIEEDVRPVAPTDLAKKDAERRRKAEQYAQRLRNETAGDRAQATRERDRDRRERADAVDDVFSVHAIAMLGRESVAGHDAIAFSLTPRQGVRTKTRDGKYLRYFKGKAWISEFDFDLVKLEVEAVQNLSMAMGLLARVHKGTTAVFERRKVNGDAWLPARAQYALSGRILLFKRLREGGTSEYSNYRKFTVDTSTTIAEPSSAR
jgi:hypothetical protein